MYKLNIKPFIILVLGLIVSAGCKQTTLPQPTNIIVPDSVDYITGVYFGLSILTDTSFAYTVRVNKISKDSFSINIPIYSYGKDSIQAFRYGDFKYTTFDKRLQYVYYDLFQTRAALAFKFNAKDSIEIEVSQWTYGGLWRTTYKGRR